MHPELKAYLDDYHARTMARYDAVDKQYALMLKILTGVSIPQAACPMGTTTDGGLTDGASVLAVVPGIFSATTQAQEPPAVSPDAPSVCIERVPVTCSTECLTQIASITSVDEVHDNATAANPEPVDDLIHQEVASEIVTPVATTTEVDPKTSVQELDHSPLPSINNSTQVVSEADHIVVLLVPSNLAAPAPSKCLAECSAYVGHGVKPLTATINSASETHDTAITERLHPPSFEHQPWPPPIQVQIRPKGNMSRPCPWPSFDCFHEGAQLRYTWPKIASVMHHFAGSLHSPTKSLRCRQRMHLKLLCSSFPSNCQAVQLWSELPSVEFQFCAHGPTDPKIMRETWWCLLKITYKISQLDHLFRPRQWWSLKNDSVAGYLEELSSGTHHQPHEVSGFSVELVPLPLSDVSSPQVPYRQSNSMDESFCCLPGAKLQFGRPPDHATAGNIIQMSPVRVRISHRGHLFRPRQWPSFKNHSNTSCPEESSSSAPLPSDDTQSRHLSRLHFHAYQNGSSSRMSWDPGNHIMSNLEKPFSCFQGTQLQSRHTPDRTKSGAIKSRREEAIHWEQVHYKDLQFYPYSLEQSLEGDENFIPCQSAYGFDLEMSELVSNMWKSDHGWAARLYLVQQKYMLFGGLCSNPSYAFHLSIKCWFEQQNERTYSLLVAVELPLHPMHMSMLQTMVMFRELLSAVTIENKSSDNSVMYPGNEQWHSEGSRLGEQQLPFPVSAMSIKQLLFQMKTITEFVAMLKIYSNLLQVWIAPLLGSESTRTCHLEQLWDPGGNSFSVWISHSSEETAHCRGMSSGDQNSVDVKRLVYSVGQLIDMVHKWSSQYHAKKSHNLTHNCCIGFGIPLAENGLLELELLIPQPGEHLPLLQPKPPWSPLAPPTITTEFSSKMRTNSKFLHLAGVLRELTQFWAYVDHASTLSSYWWCFSWEPDAGLITTLFCLTHINAEKLHEGMPCIFESSTTCGGLHAMRSMPEDYPTTFIVRWQFIQSVQPATSCVQWDPGGFDFAELAENGHWLGGKPVVKEEGMSATQNTTKGSKPTKPLVHGLDLKMRHAKRGRLQVPALEATDNPSGLGSRTATAASSFPCHLLPPVLLIPPPQPLVSELDFSVME